MELKLDVEVTQAELEYRTKHYHDLREQRQRELSCASCGNVLSQEAEEIFSHPIFGILQCRKCNDRVRELLDSNDASTSCHVCSTSRKNLYKCEKKNCSYKICQACIKRNVPKSLTEAESKKWKCLVCNSKPLWKLRGVCAAVMSSISKRTERKKVSRKRSNEREEKKSDLKNVSYIGRRRLIEAKQLRKHLDSVCDEDSPPHDTLPSHFGNVRNDKGKKRDLRSTNKNFAEDSNRGVEEESSSDSTSRSEDSDVTEVAITKTMKSTRSSTKRGDSPERRKDARNKDKNKKSLRSAETSSRNASMSLRRFSTSNSDSSSDDTDTESQKRAASSKYGKRKIKPEAVESKSKVVNLDNSSEEENHSRKRRRKSPTIESSSSRGKSVRTTRDSKKNLKKADPSDEEDDSDNREGDAKESSKNVSNAKRVQNEPVGKSTREDSRLRKSRRDKNSSERTEDSEEGTTQKRLLRNKNTSAGESETMKEKGKKTVHHKRLLSKKSPSDSSSGKEFTDSKLFRSSHVTLKRISELEEDYTKTPEDSPENLKDVLTNDQTFALKNSVTNFFSELKKAASKLVNDIEIAQTKYCMKNSMRPMDADLLILETKNVVTNLKQCVDRGECKIDDYYDKWCKKTKIKNVLKSKRKSNEHEIRSSSPSKKSGKILSKKSKDSDEDESIASEKSVSPSRSRNVTNSPLQSPNVKETDKQADGSSDFDSDEIFSGDEAKDLAAKRKTASARKENDETQKSPNSEEDKTSENKNILSNDSEKKEYEKSSGSSSRLSDRSNDTNDPEENEEKEAVTKSILRTNVENNRDSIDPSDIDIFETSIESLKDVANVDDTTNKNDEQSDNEEKSSSKVSSKSKKNEAQETNDKDSSRSQSETPSTRENSPCLDSKRMETESNLVKTTNDDEGTKEYTETEDKSDESSSDTESTLHLPILDSEKSPKLKNVEEGSLENVANVCEDDGSISEPSTEKNLQTDTDKEEMNSEKGLSRMETSGDEKEFLEEDLPAQECPEDEKKDDDDDAGNVYSLETVIQDKEDEMEASSKQSPLIVDKEKCSSIDGELEETNEENFDKSGSNTPSLDDREAFPSDKELPEDNNVEEKLSSKSTEINDSSRRSSLGSLINEDLEKEANKSSSKSSSEGSRNSVSSDPSETDDLKIRDMLLMSSNSDESSPEDSSALRNLSNIENEETPPTPPESDSNSRESTAKETTEPENDGNDKQITTNNSKRKKFRLEDRHPLLMTDKKLKQRCKVRVERLEEKILKRHKRALKKSRDYVEAKELKRLVALDNLDKKKRHAKHSESEEDDATSSTDLKTRNKSQGKKERAETLLDHLEKVGNGKNKELSNESDDESMDKENDNNQKTGDRSDDSLFTEADRMAKKRLLESSDSGGEEPSAPQSDKDNEDKEEKNDEEETEKKVKKVVKKEKLDESPEDEEKKQEKAEKGRWRKNKILTLRISDSDSDEEKKKFDLSQESKAEEKRKDGSQSDTEEEKSQKKKRVRRRVLHSDSDVKLSSQSESESSDDSVEEGKKKKKDEGEGEGKKKTRKRIRKGEKSSEDSSDSLEEKRPKNRRKRIKTADSDSDSDLENSQGTPGKSGRKNIRKVIRDKQVADDTKQAAKDEEERLQRIAERQKLYNEMYETRLAGEARVDKLVLDFDEETKEPLVSVDEALVKKLKPHQAQGIKFMWDACFESLERTKSTTGSGCILAHCMGLGKTFQIVALSHTLLQHEETGIKTIMIVCPLSTVLNWVNEFKIWLEELPDGDDIEVYELTRMKKNFERKYQLQRWQKTGGVMIIGYEMFRNLSNTAKKVRKNIQDVFLKCLVNPGPDLIVCDEGHLLKNEDTALSKAMRRVKTLRRIVLTGTPLQNNLIEYHCMVQFVKPNLLGTKKEFTNRFENPITNGQFDDSTEYDVRLMKKRAHVLHKMLEGSVQRLDYSVLTPFLPPKQEYVIFVKLTEIQISMYRHYLEYYSRRHRGVGGSLFADFQALQRIWTHPMVMRMNAKKVELANEKKRLDATDSEGSLRDFIDDGSDSASSNSSDVRSTSGSEEETSNKPKRGTRANPVPDEPPTLPDKTEDSVHDDIEWWTQFVKEEDYEDMRISSKLLLLFSILKESHSVGDKVLVFSQSLYSLTLIEEFLRMIDDETQSGNENIEHLDNHTGSWSLGLDYFRLDGQSSTDNRRRWCDIFNRPSNTRARLFLISTRAGGLGINLTAANRVIIFDASWNPSHDVQSIFRIYRFGQKKPCYVYRLLAAGTMEEKIYNRQVTKLSLSCRVVDEQQIERHYSNNALAELYKLEISETETTLNLPKDRLLAEIFLKYKHCVENYHEHDSLLENQEGEELDEEERKQAWLEYEEEKKGRRYPPIQQTPLLSYQDELLMQQMNLINMAKQNQTIVNPAMMVDFENIKQMMSKDYPGVSEAQQNAMATRTVYEMYNYVERQAMARQNPIALMNIPGGQAAFNNLIVQPSPAPPHPTPEMIKLYQQSLIQQHNGQLNYVNRGLVNDSMGPVRNPPNSQMTQLPTQSLAPIVIDDDDIIEIPATNDKTPVPPPPVPGGSRKSQEE